MTKSSIRPPDTLNPQFLVEWANAQTIVSASQWLLSKDPNDQQIQQQLKEGERRLRAILTLEHDE